MSPLVRDEAVPPLTARPRRVLLALPPLPLAAPSRLVFIHSGGQRRLPSDHMFGVFHRRDLLFFPRFRWVLILCTIELLQYYAHREGKQVTFIIFKSFIIFELIKIRLYLPPVRRIANIFLPWHGITQHTPYDQSVAPSAAPGSAKDVPLAATTHHHHQTGHGTQPTSVGAPTNGPNTSASLWPGANRPEA
jgi:hypothetical protein